MNRPVITFQPVHNIIHDGEPQYPKIISITLTFVRPHVSVMISAHRSRPLLYYLMY